MESFLRGGDDAATAPAGGGGADLDEKGCT